MALVFFLLLGLFNQSAKQKPDMSSPYLAGVYPSKVDPSYERGELALRLSSCVTDIKRKMDAIYAGISYKAARRVIWTMQDCTLIESHPSLEADANRVLKALFVEIVRCRTEGIPATYAMHSIVGSVWEAYGLGPIPPMEDIPWGITQSSTLRETLVECLDAIHADFQENITYFLELPDPRLYPGYPYLVEPVTFGRLRMLYEDPETHVDVQDVRYVADALGQIIRNCVTYNLHRHPRMVTVARDFAGVAEKQWKAFDLDIALGYYHVDEEGRRRREPKTWFQFDLRKAHEVVYEPPPPLETPHQADAWLKILEAQARRHGYTLPVTKTVDETAHTMDQMRHASAEYDAVAQDVLYGIPGKTTLERLQWCLKHDRAMYWRAWHSTVRYAATQKKSPFVAWDSPETSYEAFCRWVRAVDGAEYMADECGYDSDASYDEKYIVCRM